jgi:hypothetical protein
VLIASWTQLCSVINVHVTQQFWASFSLQLAGIVLQLFVCESFSKCSVAVVFVLGWIFHKGAEMLNRVELFLKPGFAGP